MKYQPKPLGEDCAIDWTPMIDVTFQLISFFMFTLSMSVVDQDQQIRLPNSELAKPQEDAYDHAITTQVRSNGVIVLAGQEHSLESFRDAMLNEAAVQRRLKKKTLEHITIVVRADGNAATGKVQEVIRKCQEAEFQNFVLRAKQQQPET